MVEIRGPAFTDWLRRNDYFAQRVWGIHLVLAVALHAGVYRYGRPEQHWVILHPNGQPPTVSAPASLGYLIPAFPTDSAEFTDTDPEGLGPLATEPLAELLYLRSIGADSRVTIPRYCPSCWLCLTRNHCGVLSSSVPATGSLRAGHPGSGLFRSHSLRSLALLRHLSGP